MKWKNFFQKIKKINEFLKKLDYKIVGGVGKELFFKK